MRRLAWLWCVFIGFSAAAGEPREVFERELTAAKKLYDQLEYEEALTAFRKVVPLAPTSDDRVTALLFEGIVAAETYQPRAADEAFKSAAELDPEAELPAKVSPKVRARFDQARAQARKKLGEAEVERLIAEKRSRRAAAEALAQPVAPPPPPPVVQQAPPPVVVAQTPRAPSLRQYAWIPAVAGAGVAAAGTALVFVARGDYARIVEGRIPRSQLPAVKARGERAEIAAWTLVGIGAAGLLAGGGLALFGGSAPATPTVWMGNGAGGFSVSGTIP